MLNIYITRRTNWTLPGQNIELSEWQAYIESQPDLLPRDTARTYSDKGERIEIRLPGLAIWDHPHCFCDDDIAFFHWSDGNIATRDTAAGPMLEKMLEIALALDACVQDEEGNILGPEDVHRFQEHEDVDFLDITDKSMSCQLHPDQNTQRTQNYKPVIQHKAAHDPQHEMHYEKYIRQQKRSKLRWKFWKNHK